MPNTSVLYTTVAKSYLGGKLKPLAFYGLNPGPNILYTLPARFDFIFPMYFLEVYSKLNSEHVKMKVDLGLEEVFLLPIIKYPS